MQKPQNTWGTVSLIPGLGRSPRGGNGNPLQDSCWDNPMDREAWQATVYELTKSWTWLSMHTYTHASIKRWSQANIIAWSQHPCFRSFQILERWQYVCFTLIMQCFKDSGIAPHEKTFRCKNTISLLIPSWIKHINYLMCFHICFLTWQGLFFFTF